MGKKAVWYYKDDDGWCAFKEKDIVEIEQHFNDAKKKSQALKLTGWFVSFSDMKRMRLDDPSNEQEIKRELVSSK